jgi:hypothetical protein
MVATISIGINAEKNADYQTNMRLVHMKIENSFMNTHRMNIFWVQTLQLTERKQGDFH